MKKIPKIMTMAAEFHKNWPEWNIECDPEAAHLVFSSGIPMEVIPFTIGIEASVHNTTLAFLVAGTLLHNPEMEKPALIYAMFSFWTAVLYSIVVKKANGIGIFSDFKT